MLSPNESLNITVTDRQKRRTVTDTRTNRCTSRHTDRRALGQKRGKTDKQRDKKQKTTDENRETRRERQGQWRHMVHGYVRRRPILLGPISTFFLFSPILLRPSSTSATWVNNIFRPTFCVCGWLWVLVCLSLLGVVDFGSFLVPRDLPPPDSSLPSSGPHFPRCISTIPWKALQILLEDGELQKMLTPPLYVQKASGKPDALVVQEREVSAQLIQADRKESLRSHSSESQKASGKPDSLF